MTSSRTVPLRTAIGMAAGAVAVFFCGIYAAHALTPGNPGVSPRTAFTISGHLTGVGTTTSPGLAYTFHKGASICNPLPTGETYDPVSGNYSVQLDYSLTGDGGVACTPGFFDGSDITVDVLAGSTQVVMGQPINPVPYAQFAAVAGTANSLRAPLLTATSVSERFGTADAAVLTVHATESISSPVPLFGSVGHAITITPTSGTQVLVQASVMVNANVPPGNRIFCQACILVDGACAPATATGAYLNPSTIDDNSDQIPIPLLGLLALTPSTHAIDIGVFAGGDFGDSCYYGNDGNNTIIATIVGGPGS